MVRLYAREYGAEMGKVLAEARREKGLAGDDEDDDVVGETHERLDEVFGGGRGS